MSASKGSGGCRQDRGGEGQAEEGEEQERAGRGAGEGRVRVSGDTKECKGFQECV